MRGLSVLLAAVMSTGSLALAEEASSVLASQAPQRERSPWSVNFFNIAGSSVQALSEGGAQVSSYGYFGFNYRLGHSERLAIRPAFNLETAGYDFRGRERSMDARLSDLQLEYAHFNPLDLPGGWRMAARFRAYLPVSQSSQERNNILRLGSWVSADRWIGRGLRLSYHLKPSYYMNSTTTYTSVITTADGREIRRARSTRMGTFEQYAQLSYVYNRSWGYGLQAGTYTELYNASPANDMDGFSIDRLRWGPQVEYAWSRRLNFIAGVRNSITIGSDLPAMRPDRPTALMRPDEMEYYVMTFARI